MAVILVGSCLGMDDEPTHTDHGGREIGLFLTLNDQAMWDKAMKDLCEERRGPGVMYEISIKKLVPDNGLRCELDGNALCIHGPGFVNLQESEALFVQLLPEDLPKLRKLMGAI